MRAAEDMVEIFLQITAPETPFVDLVIPVCMKVHTCGEEVVLQFGSGNSSVARYLA